MLMPAGSSWKWGRRREREEGRREKVGTDTKFFPRETGGRAAREKKMTQRKGNKEKEAEGENELKFAQTSACGHPAPPCS